MKRIATAKPTTPLSWPSELVVDAGIVGISPPPGRVIALQWSTIHCAWSTEVTSVTACATPPTSSAGRSHRASPRSPTRSGGSDARRRRAADVARPLRAVPPPHRGESPGITVPGRRCGTRPRVGGRARRRGVRRVAERRGRPPSGTVPEPTASTGRGRIADAADRARLAAPRRTVEVPLAVGAPRVGIPTRGSHAFRHADSLSSRAMLAQIRHRPTFGPAPPPGGTR